MMLRQLVKLTDAYPLTEADIALITTASSLHDIGKIRIPEEILNKPGKLSDEEFKIMKTHSELGASIIRDMRFPQNHPLVHTAWEICRWHHERWDGKGYPDGLKGEKIPISAQVVSIADVYDALTSERCYKKAFDHDTAIQLILDGQCGQFNPLLLKCLKKCCNAGNHHNNCNNGREKSCLWFFFPESQLRKSNPRKYNSHQSHCQRNELFCPKFFHSIKPPFL